MGDTIVMLSRNRVKEGMLDEFVSHYRQSISAVEADKPGTFAQLTYINDEGTGAIIVRVFAHSEAMDNHLQGADERSKLAYQFIEPTEVEIYGAPSSSAMEMIARAVGEGVGVNVYSYFIGGLVRTKTG